MRVSVLQENFAKGLSIVQRAVATRSTLPVLSNVLLSTDDGRLKLAATNLELGIVCWVGAKVETEGAITLPARTLTDLVTKLPPERIDIELDAGNNTLHLRCGTTDANIRGIGADDFPVLPEAPSKGVAVKPEALHKMISQVVIAAATDDSRPILTGVLARLEDGDAPQLTLASADGFRLSVNRHALAEGGTELQPLIIPRRTLEELARLTADQAQDVIISAPAERAQVMFKMENVEVISQLIDGQFPNFEAIIPTSYSTRAVLDTAEFLRACRRVEIFAREINNTIHAIFTPDTQDADLKPGKVTLSATSNETGEGTSVMTAVVEGKALEITFNVRYLLDVLSVVESDQVVLEMSGPANPGLLRPSGDDEFTHVIMPMHSR
jgi:DNA polymerase-3 subunit beta